MKKIHLFVMVMVLAAMTLTPVAAFAATKTTVVYTFTVADLGQGFWGGGALKSDSTATGNVPFSAKDPVTGQQTIFQITPTSWSVILPDQLIEVCFTARPIKGDAFVPPSFCITLPVTGTPVNVGGFIIRVTPAK